MTKLKIKTAEFYDIPLLLIITGSLLNIDYFFNPTFASYYIFCTTALIFTAYVAINNICKGYSLSHLKLPLLYFAIWFLYILFHNIYKSGSSSFLLYISAHLLLLFSLVSAFSSTEFKFYRFFTGIIAVSVLESCYCILQFTGFLKSKSDFFPVTGTWMNPNVTAIFLAMSVPVFLYRFKSPHKKKYLMGFTIVITALLLLKCRAAIIGSAVAAAVYFSLEYSFISWAKKEKNRTTLKALIVISLLVLAALGNQLYKSKKASADGRIFIWKLSSLMIMDNPVLGCGYGLFQRDFNLFQAQYIQEGKATPKELQNAGPTVFAQNEILQNLTEGGFTGLLIMSCFFGSLIISVRQKRNPVKAVLAQEKTSADHSGSLYNLSYAGVVAFLSMGLVNFTIQSVPAMAMMTIYAAIICSIIEPVKLSSRLIFLEKHRSFSITAYTALIFVSIYLMFSIFAIASADIQNRKAFLLKKEGHIQKALLCMPSLEKRLKNNCDYWKNYAGIHFKMQNYSSAIRCIQKAKETSVHPELYLASGVCYEKLKQYLQAVKQYYQLVMLHPSKFAYRFALMNAYLQNKDTANTVKEARGILDLHPKIFSDKVTHYKRAAYKLLKILDYQQHPASEISKITK